MITAVPRGGAAGLVVTVVVADGIPVVLDVVFVTVVVVVVQCPCPCFVSSPRLSAHSPPPASVCVCGFIVTGREDAQIQWADKRDSREHCANRDRSGPY